MRLSEEESIPVFCGAGVKITGRFWVGPTVKPKAESGLLEAGSWTNNFCGQRKDKIALSCWRLSRRREMYQNRQVQNESGQ